MSTFTTTVTTLGTFKSGASLVRFESGRLAIMLATDDPDHVTQPHENRKTGKLEGGGNQAWKIGAMAWDRVEYNGVAYTLTGMPQLVMKREPTAAEKAREKAAKKAAEAAAALAEAEALEAAEKAEAAKA